MSISLLFASTMTVANDFVFSLLYAYSLERCLVYNGLWLRLPISDLTSTLPFFLSSRVPVMSGPAAVPSCNIKSAASLVNRNGQRGLSRSHGVEFLGKHFKGSLLFKEGMPFCPWLVLLPTAWNTHIMAGAATGMATSMR